MNEVKADDIHMAQSYRISRMEFDANPERFAHMADSQMRMAIADFIQHERAKEHFDEVYVEKRIDLYVATPEQFWAIVRAEAEKAARFWGMAPR